MAPAAMDAAPAPAPVAVVTVPFPAQGHLNQMLHLSLLLASRGGLDVHYAAPAPHVRQARARVQGWDARAVRSLRFATLDGIPPYAAPPPDPDSPVAFPGHLQPLFDAFCDHAAPSLRRLLEDLAASHRRVVVVHDNLVAFPASEASRLSNGAAYGLQCVGQSFGAGFKDPSHPLVRALGLPVPSPESFLTEEFMALVARQGGLGAPGAGLLLNSCRALEGDFIDAQAEALALDGGKKLFSIGPLNPLLELDAAMPASPVQPQSQPRHECMDWLDEQPPASVLYLCFGTMTSLPGKQIEELAAALEGSEHRFIWVLRDADRADIFAEAGESSRRHAKLMSEFTKRTQGRGMVVTGWAPQLEILAHGATAAFVSHCGWNSLLEGLSHGKPILAWPMHSDQPWNAGYVCGHLRAGILMKPWEKSRETLPAKEIQEVINRAMGSGEGVAVRNAAKALAEDVRAAVANGGSSWADMEEFVAHITK